MAVPPETTDTAHVDAVAVEMFRRKAIPTAVRLAVLMDVGDPDRA
jgi:hypothetical protein